MTNLKKARREVERQLEQRSASIEGTVTRLKSDITLPVSPVSSFVKRHPYESLLGLVAVSAAAAFLVFTRTGKESKPGGKAETGLADAYATLLAERIRDGESHGMSPEEAIGSAVRANPPVVIPPERRGPPKYLSRLTDRLVNTATTLAFDYAANWLDDAMKRRNGTG